MKRLSVISLLFFVSVTIIGCGGKSKEDIASEIAQQKANQEALAEKQQLKLQAEAKERKMQEELDRQLQIASLETKLKAMIPSNAGAKFLNSWLSNYAFEKVLCGQVKFKNEYGIEVTKEFVATEKDTFLDGDNYQEHTEFSRSARNYGCLDAPSRKLADSTDSDEEYKSLNAINIGTVVYLRNDHAHVGTIVDTDANHRFEDGSVREGVKLDSGVWIPRETAKKIYLTK